jgi:hypothetical protein
MKAPYLDKDNVVRYAIQEATIKPTVYTPVGAFITAHARFKTITTAQACYNRFIYADTDSLHLTGLDNPDIEIHPSKMGAWKLESTFTDCKFLRSKSYMETIDGEVKIKCAGMPDIVKKQVDYSNFETGTSYGGKLRPHRYKGGIVLENSNFTIKAGL